MKREQVIEEIRVLIAFFEEESGATPICLEEAIRLLREDEEELR